MCIICKQIYANFGHNFCMVHDLKRFCCDFCDNIFPAYSTIMVKMSNFYSFNISQKSSGVHFSGDETNIRSLRLLASVKVIHAACLGLSDAMRRDFPHTCERLLCLFDSRERDPLTEAIK